MGLWLTVGKAALKVGVPALTEFARKRLARKAAKANRDDDNLDAAQWHQARRRREKSEARDRAKAAR